MNKCYAWRASWTNRCYQSEFLDCRRQFVIMFSQGLTFECLKIDRVMRLIVQSDVP